MNTRLIGWLAKTVTVLLIGGAFGVTAQNQVVPPARPLIHSVRSGSGSGIHSPT